MLVTCITLCVDVRSDEKKQKRQTQAVTVYMLERSLDGNYANCLWPPFPWS